MKKILIFLQLTFFLLIHFSSPSLAQYLPTQITNNSINDNAPQSNASGDMVWEASDGNDLEIFFYNAATSVTSSLTHALRSSEICFALSSTVATGPFDSRGKENVGQMVFSKGNEIHHHENIA